jgi:hypothetical protein
VSAADPLADFFTATPRHSAELTGRGDTRGEVDQILNELEVPATVDADGDWRFETDVGPFLIVIDKSNGDLVALQTIRVMDEGLESHADDMYLLMQLNLEAEGARFAGLRDGEVDLLILTSRVTADAISPLSVQTMLVDAMRLSRRLDEVAAQAPEPADRSPAGER